jgi:hypothetical protein
LLFLKKNMLFWNVCTLQIQLNFIFALC